MQLNIKKRLFISNILMIVIPAVIAVISVLIFLMIFFLTVFHGVNFEITNEQELSQTRYVLVEAVESVLDDPQDARQLDSLVAALDEHHFLMQVRHGGEELYRLGSTPVESEGVLNEALDRLGGVGTVSDGSYELFAQAVTENGESYEIRLYNQKMVLSQQTLQLQEVLLFLGLIVLVLIVILLTNRFLTKFVLGRIEEPLEILSAGVHQIRDGNLTYRIRYEHQDEFQPICEDFNEMASQLKDSVEQARREEENRKELLASISHDLRSPLTSIRAYVEGLSDGVAATPEMRQAYLSTIRVKTEEIDQLVKKLFLFSKLDMEQYPYEPEKLDAGGEILDFIEASSEEYKQKGLQIHPHIPDGPYPIYADPIYLRSILTNLLDNSAKYKAADLGNAAVACTLDSGQIRITLDDDGPGVPPESLGRLFDVFYRIDSARNNPTLGSGLGLAIVAKTVRRMDGTIRAENLPEGGLRMTILLPIWKGDDQPE